MAQLHLISTPSTPRLELAYLLVAALCLISALYFLRVALVPVAAFVRAIVAAMVVAIAISAALVLLTMAVLMPECRPTRRSAR
jgi:hypothetical protein